MKRTILLSLSSQPVRRSPNGALPRRASQSAVIVDRWLLGLYLGSLGYRCSEPIGPLRFRGSWFRNVGDVSFSYWRRRWMLLWLGAIHGYRVAIWVCSYEFPPRPKTYLMRLRSCTSSPAPNVHQHPRQHQHQHQYQCHRFPFAHLRLRCGIQGHGLALSASRLTGSIPRAPVVRASNIGSTLRICNISPRRTYRSRRGVQERIKN